MSALKASDVLNLLIERHKGDVFSREMAIGPYGHRRLDGWAMKASHSKPCVMGYEVKVSRADWMQDDKYHEYLPACNQLFVVCPWGMIDPAEVVKDSGLIYVLKNGTGLRVKKKAPYRTDDLDLEAVYKQLLMKTFCNFNGSSDPITVADWKRWLDDKSEVSAVGRKVSKMIASRLLDRERELTAREEEVRKYSADIEALRDLNISASHGDKSEPQDVEDSKAKILEMLDPVMKLARDAKEALGRYDYRIKNANVELDLIMSNISKMNGAGE